MMMIPPAPGKRIATTSSLLLVGVITMVLATGFFFLVKQIFSEASRPVSEEEKEQFWRNVEQIQANKRLAERTNSANPSGQFPGK